MVKNTQGGSRHKSQARKIVNAVISDNVRFPKEEGECFAMVSKMLGNGMCNVNLIYESQLLTNIVCHIRGKFRSRNKKSNFVSIGSTILVGIRSWTSNINACDLLFVYPDNHISSLNIPNSLIQSVNYNHSISNDSDSFVFSNSIDNDLDSHIDSHFNNGNLNDNINNDNNDDDDDDIDFDCI